MNHNSIYTTEFTELTCKGQLSMPKVNKEKDAGQRGNKQATARRRNPCVLLNVRGSQVKDMVRHSNRYSMLYRFYIADIDIGILSSRLATLDRRSATQFIAACDSQVRFGTFIQIEDLMQSSGCHPDESRRSTRTMFESFHDPAHE